MGRAFVAHRIMGNQTWIRDNSGHICQFHIAQNVPEPSHADDHVRRAGNEFLSRNEPESFPNSSLRTVPAVNITETLHRSDPCGASSIFRTGI